MFISWGVLLQFGAMWARYAKSIPKKGDKQAIWFTVHQIVQPLAWIVSLVGFAIAIAMVHPNHFAARPITRNTIVSTYTLLDLLGYASHSLGFSGDFVGICSSRYFTV